MKKRTFTDIQAVRAGIACAAEHFQKGERFSSLAFLESSGYGDNNTSVLLTVHTYNSETGKEREIWVNVWINQKADHSAKINAELHDTLY